MALDESNDKDKLFTVNDFTFCIEDELLEKVKSITIDLTYMGFTVEPELPLGSDSGSSSCGGCSSASGCSTQ